MNERSAQTAGFDACDNDPKQMSADEALENIRRMVDPVHQVETVAVREALGRVTAEDIRSAVDVPNHTNSAMDGYALRGDDLSQQDERRFPVIGVSMAGAPYNGAVGAGESVRIMTGAVMPEGADSVVIQENVDRQGDTITVGAGEKARANVRYAGEDLKVGEVAIAAGRRLDASHLGLAASLGFSELPVTRRLRVAIFSNGDELRSVGTPLNIGELYDSNRYTLHGMLTEMGVDLVDLGIVADDPQAIRDAFIGAAQCADVVVTSAGASVGDADYVKQTLDELGEVSFWKVAIKPGRPLAFGRVGESLFFGLPGNPVSVMVTFQIFVKPALRLLSGESFTTPLKLQVKTTCALKKRPGRTEYQRGVLGTDANGNSIVHTTGEQGSGILSSMGQANCFIVLPADSGGAAAGDLVEVQPFSSIG